MNWKKVENLAVAVFNFTAQNEHHLTIQVGDLLYIKEKSAEWYHGYLYYKPDKMGIFPCSFVHAKDHEVVQYGDKSYLVPTEDAVSIEAKETLREWKTKLLHLYTHDTREKYRALLHAMEEVLAQRRLLSNATREKLQATKDLMTATMDQFNSQLQLPVTARDNQCNPVDPIKTSIPHLHRLHQKRAEASHEASDTSDPTKALKKQELHTYHLLMRVNRVEHVFPEDCDMFFFLYNVDKHETISERFIIHMPKTGNTSEAFNLTANNSVLFTDLAEKDMDIKGMEVICQIVRRGKMLLDDRKGTGTHLRRPYAYGGLDVQPVLKDRGKGDTLLDGDEYRNTHTLSVFVCQSQSQENEFAALDGGVMKKLASRGGQKQCTVLLNLKVLTGDLNTLKRDLPNLKDAKMTTVAHKLGFPDIILPGYVRNDIYVTLSQSQFDKGEKRAERNVEVSIVVRDNDGKLIPRTILLGANEDPTNEFQSFIFYHNNMPRWNETFKLSIPYEKINDAHLCISFRHLAKKEVKDKMEKTFAYSFLKVMKEDGSILADGDHYLSVFKAENKKWFEGASYLQQKGSAAATPPSSKTLAKSMSFDIHQANQSTLARPRGEFVVLSTLTCSTKLTQKVELLMLLKWKMKQHDLTVTLTNITHVDGEEVVKFLQDTLDCLFEILNTTSERYQEPVFTALVSIFKQLNLDRYCHFSTVVDVYLSKHFSATQAYKYLVWCFNSNVKACVSHAASGLAEQFLPMLESMQLIFRFMVQSYVLHQSATKSPDPSFKFDLEESFTNLSELMILTEDKAKGVHLNQSAVLIYLPNVLPEITHIFSIEEIASLLSKFLNSIQTTADTVLSEKLHFIQKVITSSVRVLSTPAARDALLPTIVNHLIMYMDSTLPKHIYKAGYVGNRDCFTCVGKVLETFSEPSLAMGARDIHCAVALFQPFLKLHSILERHNDEQFPILNVVNFTSLLSLMQDEHYSTFFAQLNQSEGGAKVVIKEFLQWMNCILDNPLFHKEWITLYFVQSSVFMKALRNVSSMMSKTCVSDQDFSKSMWESFFAFCISFITQPCLQLEQFSDIYQTKFKTRFGDMRLSMAQTMLEMWGCLDSKRSYFIPELIGPILEVTLIKQKDLRKMTIPLVFDVMKCEQQTSGNFKRVETEVFEKMDNLLSRGQGDEAYKEMFSEILMELCDKCTELDPSASKPFIETVSRMIGLLLDYHNVENDDSCRGRRMGCMFNLLNFYHEIKKEELYIRYIYKLADLHEHDHSYTEAGFTLLLHIKKLQWNDDVVAAAGTRYPAQTASQRLERLYQDATRLFDEGKCWEYGVTLCKEMAKVYELELFDYQKLADILSKEAEFRRKIIRELRVEPEYFRVGYYGKGFPLFLRNKAFVHRGQPYEKLGSFIKRITDEFPTAQLMKSNAVPDSDLQASNTMHLQIRKVTPVTDEKEIFKGKRVPDKIIEFYKTNDIRKFHFDFPFHKGQKNPECEFASMWIERSTFVTKETFPGVIGWFEITSTDTLELNPLDIALQTVRSKTKELGAMVVQHGTDPNLSISPLSLLLNGIIDAAVMGGIGIYNKIFFATSYLTEHPDHAEGVKQLRTAIEEQAMVVEKALVIHKSKIDSSLQGLQEKLETCFEEFLCMVYPDRKASKAKMAAASATLSRPLPTTPLDSTQYSSPQMRKGSTQTMGGGRRNTGAGYAKLNSLIETEDDLPKKNASKRAMTVKQGKKSPSVSSSSSPPAFRKSSEHRVSLRESVGDRSSIISEDSLKSSSSHLHDTYEDVRDMMDPDRLSNTSGGQQTTPLPAPPSYPAPRPPSTELDEEDNIHSYEKVTLNPTTGGVTIAETKEWAVLPGAKDHPMYQTGLGKQAPPPAKDGSKPQCKDARLSTGSSGSGGASDGGDGGSGSSAKVPLARGDSTNFIGKTSGSIFESLYDGLSSAPSGPQAPPAQRTGNPAPIAECIYEFDKLSPSPTHSVSSGDSAEGTLPTAKGFVGDRSRKLSPAPPPPYAPPAEPPCEEGVPTRSLKPGTSPPGRGQATTTAGGYGTHLPPPQSPSDIIPPAIPLKKSVSVRGGDTPDSVPPPIVGIKPTDVDEGVYGFDSTKMNSLPPVPSKMDPLARAVPPKMDPLPPVPPKMDSLPPAVPSKMDPLARAVPPKMDPLPPVPPKMDSLPPAVPPKMDTLARAVPPKMDAIGTQEPKPFSVRPLPSPLPDNGNQDYSFDLLGPENAPPQAVHSSSSLRPLPQPIPDDGNQDYSFDLLGPASAPPQAVHSSSSLRPLPQPPPDDGNQDYSFDLLGPENAPPQAVHSSSLRPLPQPPPDDGNQVDSLTPPPQATKTTSPMPIKPLPQPPPDDGNQDYTFDALIPLPQTPKEGVARIIDTINQFPPDDGNQDYTFDALIPLPQTPKEGVARIIDTINQFPPDDGNQDYTFDMLTLPEAPPPPIPLKTDTAGQSSKQPLPKATPTYIPPSAATPPRGDLALLQRPLPPPPPREINSNIPPDDGNQDYTFDSLISLPPPAKISAPTQGIPTVIASQKPAHSPPIPPKSKPKGAGPTGTPSRDESGVHSQDSLTTSLDASAKSVTTTMPFAKPPMAAPVSKPVPPPSKTPKSANNISKAGPGLNPSDSNVMRAMMEPPPISSSLGGMPHVPPPARSEPPEVRASPTVAPFATSPRKPVPVPQQGGGIPYPSPPVVPEARSTTATPTRAPPVQLKGNNMHSISSEYSLLGHEEEPGGGGTGGGGTEAGRRGGSEPISIPPSKSSSAPPKPPAQATGGLRRNMPLPSIPQDPGAQPPPPPHPYGSLKEASPVPQNDPAPPVPDKKRSTTNSKRSALSESMEESDTRPEVSDLDMSTSLESGHVRPDVRGSGWPGNPAGIQSPLPRGANPEVSNDKTAKPVPKARLRSPSSVDSTGDSTPLVRSLPPRPRLEETTVPPRPPLPETAASVDSTGDSTPLVRSLPPRPRLEETTVPPRPPVPETAGPALPPRPAGMRPPATLKR